MSSKGGEGENLALLGIDRLRLVHCADLLTSPDLGDAGPAEQHLGSLGSHLEGRPLAQLGVSLRASIGGDQGGCGRRGCRHLFACPDHLLYVLQPAVQSRKATPGRRGARPAGSLSLTRRWW